MEFVLVHTKIFRIYFLCDSRLSQNYQHARMYTRKLLSESSAKSCVCLERPTMFTYSVGQLQTLQWLCGDHMVLVQVPLILGPALRWCKVSSLCSVPSRLKTAQAGWRRIWLGLVRIELVLTMCRSKPWEQHVTMTKPQEDFWKWHLTLGYDNKDLLLTSKSLVFSVSIKPQIICLGIISPCQGDCLPFYPTKVQMQSDCTSLFPDAEAQELCGPPSKGLENQRGQMQTWSCHLST